MALFSTPVREYMSRGLVSVRPETTLAELQRVFDERDVSAVPIVDGAGALVGILSTTDLMRASRIELDRPGGTPRVTVPPHSVSDLMRKSVITVDEDAPLREAAQKMVDHHIHRVVVLRDGRPVAVHSTRDAMRAVHFHHVETPLSAAISAPVLTVDVGDNIESAIRRLGDVNVRGLVVVDGDWPIGVFTHTEALKATSLPHDLLASTPVEAVMSYEMICLDVATPLYRVAGHAAQTRVRRILAVEKRRLKGILTGFDLARIITMSE